MQVDRLFDWQPVPNAPIQESLASQKEHVRAQFEQRLQQTMLNLNEQGAPPSCSSPHVMSCHVILCHVMSCHVMSCHVMSCQVMACLGAPGHAITTGCKQSKRGEWQGWCPLREHGALNGKRLVGLGQQQPLGQLPAAWLRQLRRCSALQPLCSRSQQVVFCTDADMRIADAPAPEVALKLAECAGESSMPSQGWSHDSSCR